MVNKKLKVFGILFLVDLVFNILLFALLGLPFEQDKLVLLGMGTIIQTFILNQLNLLKTGD